LQCLHRSPPFFSASSNWLSNFPPPFPSGRISLFLDVRSRLPLPHSKRPPFSPRRLLRSGSVHFFPTPCVLSLFFKGKISVPVVAPPVERTGFPSFEGGLPPFSRRLLRAVLKTPSFFSYFAGFDRPLSFFQAGLAASRRFCQNVSGLAFPFPPPLVFRTPIRLFPKYLSFLFSVGLLLLFPSAGLRNIPVIPDFLSGDDAFESFLTAGVSFPFTDPRLSSSPRVLLVPETEESAFFSPTFQSFFLDHRSTFRFRRNPAKNSTSPQSSPRRTMSSFLKTRT